MTLEGLLRPRATVNKTSTAQPIAVPTSQKFDGNDGQWSTFLVTVGDPPQLFRLLPATNGQETWVPIAEGCTQPGEPSNCGDLRGVYPYENNPAVGFTANQSSTWEALDPSIYNLIMEGRLGLTGAGQYGYDTVGLGLGPTSSQVVNLGKQIVAGVATPDFWIGYLPLSNKASNFSVSIPSFLSNLATGGHIPSLSFGYTAGAKYQNKGALGSLTLGGYDPSRMYSTGNVSFTFAPDDSRSLTVGLQSITAQRTLQGTVAPLSSGILSLIDSGVPEIWLPQTACAIFEEAFGLSYDKKLNRYLVSDSVHTQLSNLNSTVTFTLGNQLSGGSTVQIELPYAAFDHYLYYPLSKNGTQGTAYFPLRRAANDTQYTLGRTFLQEAYITVDYERQNFSVAQAAFPDSSTTTLVPIRSLNDTSSEGTTSKSHHLSSSAIAGISVSLLLASLFLSGLIYLFCRHRRRGKLQKRRINEKLAHDFYREAEEAQKRRESIKHELPSASPFMLQDKEWLTPKLAHHNSQRSTSTGRATEMSAGLEDGIISPLSPARTKSSGRSATQSPDSAYRLPGRWVPPQELAGSSTAAEAHTSIWGRMAGDIGGIRHDGTSNSPGTDESSSSLSYSLSDSSSGRRYVGMAPIFELSGDSDRRGVKIKPFKPVLRHHDTAPD